MAKRSTATADYDSPWKVALHKYERNLGKDDVRELFRLLDWMLVLPDDLEERFREEIYQYEKEKSMPYLSSIERKGLEEGLKRGRAALRRLTKIIKAATTPDEVSRHLS